MKTLKIITNRPRGIHAGLATKGWLASMLVGLIGYTWDTGLCLAQEADNDVAGVQVLTRGPVHEAFAGIVTYNAEPGIVVAKAPPDAIEEIPPDERPEGDNITWIPGYWAWDDERSDFLWVSGTWRALPPDRQWMAGYWGKTTDGYQWTSGYWANATSEETTYLPAPPATVETGPSTEVPSQDHSWTPGSWVWRQERYAWSPGYWQLGRADWAWMPAHYVWTPRGYIFVDGYWDYPVVRRGTVFAPVYFDSGVYSRVGYNYSPSIVIGLALIAEQLFLRPHYHHYYFGDYYAASYGHGGFYAAYAYQSHHFGYDPIFCHQRWEHRHDRKWEKRVEETYQYRRDHEDARPPHTWADLKNRKGNPEDSKNPALVATPINQLAKKKDGPMRFEAVSKEDKKMLALRGKDVRKFRDERKTLEAKGVTTAAQNPGEVMKPSKVNFTKSPIVGKSAKQLKKNEMPPEVVRAPKADLNIKPKAETIGQVPKVDKTKQLTDKIKPDVKPREKLVIPDKVKPDVKSREKLVIPKDVQKKTPKETLVPERRVKEAPVKVKEATPGTSKGMDKNALQGFDQTTKGKSSTGDGGEEKSGKKDRKNKD